MVVGAGDRSTASSPPPNAEWFGADATDRRSRYLATWAIVFGLILVGFTGTVVALNLSVYSANGFVRSYLSALDRHDVTSAIAMPGVSLPRNTARDLLAADALGELSAIRLVDDIDEGAGTHRVTFSFELGSTPGRSEFLVEHTGARFGFFSGWRFAQAPTSTLEITPLGASQFDANDIEVESAGGASVPVPYGVLIPGVFSLSHKSDLLVAEPENILVLDSGSKTDVDVRIEANEQFVDLVQQQLDTTLDDCATQDVLQPTGCPFGERISNRVDGTPTWSIVQYPQVMIRRGTQPGTWQVPETQAVAHLVVGVRSLFDGTLSTFDEDVPFGVGYLITLLPNGQVSISVQ